MAVPATSGYAARRSWPYSLVRMRICGEAARRRDPAVAYGMAAMGPSAIETFEIKEEAAQIKPKHLKKDTNRNGW